MYQFNVHSSVYDTTTADDGSNGESVLEGSKLNVNAAAAKKARSVMVVVFGGSDLSVSKVMLLLSFCKSNRLQRAAKTKHSGQTVIPTPRGSFVK